MASKFVKISKEYFLNSSVHGLKYIAEEGRFLCERFLWLILFIGGLLISMYFTDKLWDKWQVTPAYIGLNSTSTPIAELFMPAITICSVFQQGDNFNRNRSQILKSFRNHTNANKTDLSSWRAWKNIARGLTISDENFLVDTEPIVQEYIASHNMTSEEAKFALLNIAQLIGVSCGDILTSCSWRGRNLECLELFSKQLTDDGFCCVMQETRGYDAETLAVHKSPYGTQNSNVTELLRPISAGIGSGLSVTLKKAPQPNPTLLEFASSFFVGYKVLVHSHEEYPEVHQRGFAVPTQSETYVKINPLLVGTTEAANALPVAKRRCYNNDERKLRTFRQYSLPNCLVECSALYVMEKWFKLTNDIFTEPNNTNFCDSISSLQCMKRALDEVRNNQTGLCGNCLITCKQVHFNVKVASVPSLSSINKIYFYFPDEAVTGYIRDVLYDWPGFISAAGGLLGLGFGFSLLSAAECVYFYTIRWAADKS